MDGQSTFREGLAAATEFRYQKSLADRGVIDEICVDALKKPMDIPEDTEGWTPPDTHYQMTPKLEEALLRCGKRGGGDKRNPRLEELWSVWGKDFS